MAQENNILRDFETKMRLLIMQYNGLKKDNDELFSIIEEKENNITALKEECVRLKADYDNLKLAKMIEISDGEMAGAKSKLSKLVRDIDKCIALLNS